MVAKETEGFIESDMESLIKKAALNALFRSVPIGNLDKPLPENTVNKIRVMTDDFNAALEEASSRRDEPRKDVSDTGEALKRLRRG